MSARGWNDADSPQPELLAAYVDGELGPEVRARVEGWLAEHPDLAAEVEATRRLARLWQSAPPPDPGRDAWAGLLARIEAALPEAAARRLAPWRRLAWGLGMLTAAAAALVLAASLWRGPGRLPGLEPLQVIAADDVEIISLDAEGARALVVGEPPVREQLALLAPGEATLDDVSGINHYYPRDGSMPPMLFIMPGDTEP